MPEGIAVQPGPISLAEIPVVRASYRSEKGLQATPTEFQLPSDLVVLLQNRFDTLLNEDATLADLIRRLCVLQLPCVVFGGWVRDHLAPIEGGCSIAAPRDIDLVICCRRAQLEAILGGEIERNIFGGFTVVASTTSVDIWPLADTFLIAKYGLPIEFDLLPRIADFNINAIIFRPAPIWPRPSFLDAGCFDALHGRLMRFQYDWIPFPRIQAARAVIYAAKLDMALDNEIVDFISGVCRSTDAVSEVRSGIRSYCPPSVLSTALAKIDHIVGSKAAL